MNCQEAAELMHRYLDHDLSVTENEELTQHLTDCPSCNVFFERLKRLSAELENLPRVMPPFSLVDSIIPQLDLLQDSRPIIPFKKRYSFARPYLAAAGAIAASLVLGIFLFSNQPKSMDNASEVFPQKAADTMNDTTAKADVADEFKQLNGSTEQPKGRTPSELHLDAAPAAREIAPTVKPSSKSSVNTAAPQEQQVKAASGTSKLSTNVSNMNSPELTSEDGNLIGKIDHLHVVVQDAHSKETLFTSAAELKAEDKVEFISWQDNRLLQFTLEANGVKSTYTIDIQAKTETKS